MEKLHTLYCECNICFARRSEALAEGAIDLAAMKMEQGYGKVDAQFTLREALRSELLLPQHRARIEDYFCSL